MAKRYWSGKIDEHKKVVDLLGGDEKLIETIGDFADTVVESYRNGGKLLLCGNGGSAADAQHIAAELVARFQKERKALDAEALTVNTSTLTAIGNDYSFEQIFSRQVEAKGREGDVLVGISTSGNSKNVISAIVKGNELGMVTVGLTGGKDGVKIAEVSKLCIAVPSTDTPRIQEMHILIGHMVCGYIEDKLFS
jgi:D-sedoheptulose 7-phosphate isomerase